MRLQHFGFVQRFLERGVSNCLLAGISSTRTGAIAAVAFSFVCSKIGCASFPEMNTRFAKMCCPCFVKNLEEAAGCMSRGIVRQEERTSVHPVREQRRQKAPWASRNNQQSLGLGHTRPGKRFAPFDRTDAAPRSLKLADPFQVHPGKSVEPPIRDERKCERPL